MADQVGPGTLDSALSGASGSESPQVARPAGGSSAAKTEHHHGRPVSWVAVSIIVIGFFVGGIAMIFGPTWWLCWVGGGIALIGSILAAATGIFNDWY